MQVIPTITLISQNCGAPLHCIVSKNWTPSHTSKLLNLPMDHPTKVLGGNVQFQMFLVKMVSALQMI